MTTVGRNPNRIMALIQDWSDHHRGPVRLVGEPVWPGRSEAEVGEDSEIAIALDELVRDGARRMIAAALGVEADAASRGSATS